eukprot:scaffold21422_cov98-Phaeocystis_antarctica.AAC.1
MSPGDGNRRPCERARSSGAAPRSCGRDSRRTFYKPRYSQDNIKTGLFPCPGGKVTVPRLTRLPSAKHERSGYWDFRPPATAGGRPGSMYLPTGCVRRARARPSPISATHPGDGRRATRVDVPAA